MRISTASALSRVLLTKLSRLSGLPNQRQPRAGIERYDEGDQPDCCIISPVRMRDLSTPRRMLKQPPHRREFTTHTSGRAFSVAIVTLLPWRSLRDLGLRARAAI